MAYLTAIVPFFNGHATLGNLLDSLPGWLPVIVVDDHSDKPLDVSRRNVRVIRPDEKGYFSGAVNAGIAACDTDVLVLNQDAWLGRGWQKVVLGWQSEGIGIGGDGVMKHPGWPNGYVQGTFMYMSRAAIDATGPLNARDYPLWGATAEWQMRACRKGFRAVPISPVPGLHHERLQGRHGSSIRQILKREPHNREWFIRTPPMISIIMPCYNYGRYLTDAVNSLIGGPTDLGEMPGQTFQGFEIIIVNDASQDETHEVASALADDWKAIRYVHLKENRGLPAALNAGIARARGEYISILSADDMREPWHYETFYRAMEGNKTGFVYGDIAVFRDGERTKTLVMHDYDFEKLLYRNCAGVGILYHKTAWEDAGGYPVAMRYGKEDWAFNIALGLAGHCGKKVKQETPSNLYRREQQNRSLRTQKFGVETFLTQIKALWPEIYAGERPVACCGGRARGGGGRGRAKKSTALSLPGQKGMARLEYIGPKVGSMNFRGADQRRYVFGNNDQDRVKFVDSRDLKLFLNMRHGKGKGKKPIFRRYKPASPKAKLSPEQKAIANPVLPAKEQVPASAALVEAAEGMPQDADLEMAEAEREAAAFIDLKDTLDGKENILATAKAKIEAFKLKLDLASIIGTGKGGKITVRDVRKANAATA